MANLTKFRKSTLTIDGETIPINVRRLTLEQAEGFRAFLNPFLKNREDRELSTDEAQFVRESIETYITVPPGALSMDDAPIVTGAQLLDVIGENPGLVMRALLAIAGVSTVSSAEGKAFASGSASVPSSDAPVPAPDGPTPALTVAGAEQRDAAPLVDATEATASPSSGATATISN